MTDVLDIGNAASLARTALSDPEAVPDADLDYVLGSWPFSDSPLTSHLRAAHAYAIDRMDEICNAISPPIEDRASIAAGVRAVGLALAQLQDLCRACAADEPGAPHAASYALASRALALALDFLEPPAGDPGPVV